MMAKLGFICYCMRSKCDSKRPEIYARWRGQHLVMRSKKTNSHRSAVGEPRRRSLVRRGCHCPINARLVRKGQRSCEDGGYFGRVGRRPAEKADEALEGEIEEGDKIARRLWWCEVGKKSTAKHQSREGSRDLRDLRYLQSGISDIWPARAEVRASARPVLGALVHTW